MISNDNAVKKSNEFSMAKMSESLTLNQMQLLIYTIFRTQQDSKVTEFARVDFENKFELSRYQSAQAKKDARKLLKLDFSTEDLEKDSFEYLNVFQKISYDNGKFSFKWTEDMLPHITGLKEKYVMNDLAITAQFNSSFSWKLYDYLKANYGNWYKQLSKEATLRLFGVEDRKTYQNKTFSFKRGVLDVAVEEINKYTELDVSYEDVVTKRAITGFIFKWSVGNVKNSASRKQRDEIKIYVDTMEADAIKYLNEITPEDLPELQEVIRNIAEYRGYADESFTMTKEQASRALLRIKQLFKQLQKLIKGDRKSPVFYNWLEYDSPEEQEAVEAAEEARMARLEAEKALIDAENKEGNFKVIAMGKAKALDEMATKLEAVAENKARIAVSAYQ